MNENSGETQENEFGKYLRESGGVRETLVKHLYELYEEKEKPDDPILYLQNKLGDPRPLRTEHDKLLKEIDKIATEIENIQKEVAELEYRLFMYEDRYEEGSENSSRILFDDKDSWMATNENMMEDTNLYEDFI